MNATAVRSQKTNETHLISGETPGWAYCNEWIQTGDQMPDGSSVDCRRCAAMDDRNPYAHLIGKSVIATSKGFTFVGSLRHAQEVAVPGALEVVTPDGVVDFGGLPQVFDSIEELKCPGPLSDGEGVPGLCEGTAGHDGECHANT